MNQPDFQEVMLARLEASQTPGGRFRLKAHYWRKRILWQWVISGSLLLKRCMDVIASGCALIVLSPLFLTIAILIKLEDRGPVFFGQRRVGLHGREFKMWKFRSMCVDAEQRLQEVLGKNQHQDGITFKLKDDPRVSRIGKWLRKFSLDEFPQFYNVFRGEMSLVGPRPPVPREVALYTLADRRRLSTIPGLTCFWQIGGRSEIDFSGQVQLDVQYIESQSLWLDVKILFKTVPAVVFGKGAY
jgi:exopolysaccharide biosynthesis polyprenyl glycosylphosphotransferase